MNKRLLVTMILSSMLGLVSSLPAPADVVVQFVDSQRYTDASSFGYGSDSKTLRALEGHFRTLGERCLKPGENLEIRVLNVDLAGQQEWWNKSTFDVRVMRGISWPRVDLDYVWRDSAGQVLAQVENEHLADMDYLRYSAYVRLDRDSLPYEKKMLGEWFARRFCSSHS